MEVVKVMEAVEAMGTLEEVGRKAGEVKEVLAVEMEGEVLI